MKLDSFQEVVLESSSVEELKEKVKCVTSCRFLVVSKSFIDVLCHSHRNLLHGDSAPLTPPHQEQRTSLMLLKPYNYQLLSFV